MHTLYTALRADRPQFKITPIALTWSSDSVGVSAMERNSVFSRWRAMATYIRLYSVGPDFSRERAENPCRGRARPGALGIPEPVKVRAPLKNLAASPKIFGSGFFADRRASVERPGVRSATEGACHLSCFNHYYGGLVQLGFSPICHGTARPAQARGRREKWVR
jgi:hypothetical protein